MCQITTDKTGLYVKPSRSSVLIVAVTIWAAGLSSAVATPPQGVEINATVQDVMIDGQPAVFEARILICANNQADGFLDLLLADGTALALTPVHAEFHLRPGFDGPAATLVLLPADLDRPAQPDDFVVGVFHRDEAGCDIWDFLGPEVQAGSQGRVQFDAVDTLTRTNERCEADDFGQFSSRAAIDAPPQIVFPFDRSDPLDFEASLRIHRDNGADGFVYAPLSPRGGLYEAMFGAVLRHAEGGSQFYIVGMLPASSDPPSTDDLLRATAAHIPGDTDPDCLIWDLVNGDSGGVRNAATFDAETEFKVSPRPR